MNQTKKRHIHQSFVVTHTGYGLVCMYCGATYMPPAPRKKK